MQDLVVDRPDDFSEDEEPYTQDLPDIDVSPQSRSSGRKPEPIRPGDTILYYNPIYPAGDRRGRTTTVVISINPQNKSRTLELANNAVLDRGFQVCRIKTYSRGKSTEHPGVFRKIDDFKLQKKEMSKSQRAELMTEGDRAKKILKKNIEVFEGKVGKGSGMLNNFNLEGDGGSSGGGGKKRATTTTEEDSSGSDSESDSDFEEDKLKKKTPNKKSAKEKRDAGGTGAGKESSTKKKKKSSKPRKKKKVGPLVFSKH